MNKGTILIQLQKAFDTLEHKIFLKKMTYLGFKTSIIKWFESYLRNRKFFVSVDDFFSKTGILNCGLSQGSILGTHLFLICIHVLPQSWSESGSYLHADDTCIFYQDNNDVHKIKDILQSLPKYIRQTSFSVK